MQPHVPEPLWTTTDKSDAVVCVQSRLLLQEETGSASPTSSSGERSTLCSTLPQFSSKACDNCSPSSFTLNEGLGKANLMFTFVSNRGTSATLSARQLSPASAPRHDSTVVAWRTRVLYCGDCLNHKEPSGLLWAHWPLSPHHIALLRGQEASGKEGECVVLGQRPVSRLRLSS